jgi:chromosomal replication initiator protein
VTQDPHHIWERFDAHLRATVEASTYDIWFAGLRPVRVDGAALVVAAPPRLHGWIAERCEPVLAACAADVLGPRATVDVVCEGDHGPAAAAEPPVRDDRLNPRYTFDQFVIGDANRFAHAAALAVAELPGQAYNPLFIYGPPGVGKTHLLHSIGNYVRAFGGGLTVRYATVETFTNEFLAALHGGDVERFKDRYRRNDVLLIDDVQFLASKHKTEEELFHTFNALHESGSQLVITSDRLPRNLDALQNRLRERFEAGLVTDIRPPDDPTRITVLRKRIRQDGIVPPDDAVLELIARRVRTNVRALEGALIRAVAFSSLTARPLTVELARAVLDDLYPPGHPGGRRTGGRPTVDQVQEITAEAFDVTREELIGPGRAPRLTWPRQVAMYLAREHTGATLPAIGARFGGRSHTTVLHACRRTAERVGEDPEASAIVRELTDRLASATCGPEPDRCE